MPNINQFDDRTSREILDIVRRVRRFGVASIPEISPPTPTPNNLVIGFHATTGIGAATINTSNPTLSSYCSSLCDVYRLSWNATSGKHVPQKFLDASGNVLKFWVINATSDAISSNEMLWGLRHAGVRDGVPTFMAMVADCG